MQQHKNGSNVLIDELCRLRVANSLSYSELEALVDNWLIAKISIEFERWRKLPGTILEALDVRVWSSSKG